MPYISRKAKKQIKDKSWTDLSAGELTYKFYSAAINNLPDKPRYADFHKVLQLMKQAEGLYKGPKSHKAYMLQTRVDNPFYFAPLHFNVHLYFVLGALESAKLEFYRRKVAPYEDIKIRQNGDVLRGE